MLMMAPTLAFGFSTPDIILILVVALVLFGPKNLPKMARGIGKSMEEFRRAAREIENEIMKEPEPTPPPPPPPPEAETHPEMPAEYAAPEISAEPTAPTAATPAVAPVVVADQPVALPPAAEKAPDVQPAA
jgi:TatA/E family protein of Tat protein translocase